MGCGCVKPEKTDLWTEIPPFQAPTEILPGENMDCYAARADSSTPQPEGAKPVGKIDNTGLTSDLEGNVNEQMKLTPNSPDPAVKWTATGLPPNITINESTGKISGKAAPEAMNKQHKVMVRAHKADGSEIDSREFNLYPKDGNRDETIKFVTPISPMKKITSPYGMRTHPKSGNQQFHNGVDFVSRTPAGGSVLAAADGIVKSVGTGRGYGNLIVIEHRDSQNRVVAVTKYAHLANMNVSNGQRVSAGQNIGREGTTGDSTGNHLHFEILKGGVPVNPLDYINGEHVIPVNQNPDGSPSNETVTVVRNNTGMTAGESSAVNRGNCPRELQNQFGGAGQNNPTLSNQPLSDTPTPSNPNQAQTKAEIQRALDEDPSLTDEDKKLLQHMANIESRYIADAKNPTSSARGVYQMLDKTATKYYDKIGIPPTQANRNNPYYATKAQIEFYKKEQLPAWNDFKTSGGTTLAGKALSPDLQARYANLNKGELIYGLMHHDGVGNAVRGQDMGGLDYYRKKTRQG